MNSAQDAGRARIPQRVTAAATNSEHCHSPHRNPDSPNSSSFRAGGVMKAPVETLEVGRTQLAWENRRDRKQHNRMCIFGLYRQATQLRG